MKKLKFLSILSLLLTQSSFAEPATHYMCVSTSLLGGTYEVETLASISSEWPSLDTAVFYPGRETEQDHVAYAPANTRISGDSGDEIKISGSENGTGKSLLTIDFTRSKSGPIYSRLLSAAGINPKGNVKLHPAILVIKNSTLFSGTAKLECAGVH